ncbi:MAG: tetratricopeptide repeat protein [Solirubrobacteraceae bacterium]|nr:tetratricopeptide repeat protein [Solirubrobacteraceae bacterium]
MSSLQLAAHLLNVGRPEDALRELQRLGPDEAGSVNALCLRGYAHLNTGSLDAAVHDARAGLQAAPDDIELHYLLSITETQRGDLAAAEAAILAALGYAADDAELLAQYSRVLMRGGQLEKAGRVLAAAGASDPRSQEVLRCRIDLAYLRGDTAEAEGLTHLLLADDAESVRGHQMLGVLALERGDLPVAETRLGEAVRLDPVHDEVADSARAAQILQRPYYWPVRFFDRFGAAQTWVVAICLILGLRAAGLTVAAGILGLTWMIVCAWSWAAGSRLEHQLR